MENSLIFFSALDKLLHGFEKWRDIIVFLFSQVILKLDKTFKRENGGINSAEYRTPWPCDPYPGAGALSGQPQRRHNIRHWKQKADSMPQVGSGKLQPVHEDSLGG